MFHKFSVNGEISVFQTAAECWDVRCTQRQKQLNVLCLMRNFQESMYNLEFVVAVCHSLNNNNKSCNLLGETDD